MAEGFSGFKKPYHELGILDFQVRFPNERSCRDYLVKMLWPDGCMCPKGCKPAKMDWAKKRKPRIFECRKCHIQMYVTA
jgi:hypothetical protein